MPRRTISKALTDTKVKNAKPEEKAYTLADGDGLQLLIKPNGSKLWEVRYTIEGKAKKTSVGSYPVVTLAKAREKALEHRRLAYEDVDPVRAKREAKQAAVAADKGQFHLVVREWFDGLSCSAYNAKKRFRNFERDVFPLFCKYDQGHNIVTSRHIADIGHDELYKIIKTKELQAPETAMRIYRDMKQVWEHAISSGYTEVMTPIKIKKSSLPKPPKKHYPKITDKAALRDLLIAIDHYHGQPITRLMLQFVSVVPLRADNLCNLRWDHVNLDKAVLTIKRAEMKVKDPNLPDFKIPLSHQAARILHEVHALTGWGQWVFHGLKNINGPINKETANKALRLLGFNDEENGRKQTLHSFRGTFRSLVETHRQEHAHPFEVMERSLDHHEKNRVTRAYSHQADYSKQIGELLQWWADYLDTVRG